MRFEEYLSESGKGQTWRDPILLSKNPVKRMNPQAGAAKHAYEFAKANNLVDFLNDYTGWGSTFINKKIRAAKSLGSDDVHVKDFKKYKSPCPFTVFRGFGGKLDVSKMIAGNQHVMKGFTSTSLNPEIAEDFGYQDKRVKFTVNGDHRSEHRFYCMIHIPQGANAMYLAHKELSEARHESEVLIGPDAIVEVGKHEYCQVSKGVFNHIVNLHLKK